MVRGKPMNVVPKISEEEKEFYEKILAPERKVMVLTGVSSPIEQLTEIFILSSGIKLVTKDTIIKEKEIK